MSRFSLRPNQVVSALRRAQDVHIWVIGDVMLDEYIQGSTSRVSPEAPVLVVGVGEVVHRPGGAANTARAVVALGARASLCGVVGDDASADTLLAQCREAKIGVEAIVRERNRTTTRKTRVLVGDQQVLRLDWERKAPVSDALAARAREALAGTGAPNAIILSDYAKGMLTPSVLRTTLEEARYLGIPTVVDPKGRDLSRYDGATLVKPNLGELEAIVGRSLEANDDAAIESAARHAMTTAKIEALLVTMGERGMMLVPRDAPVDLIRTRAREVFDVTGAGDTVVATFSLAVAAGMSFGPAARLANAAAGVVVGKVGAAIARPDEIADVLAARLQHNVLDREALLEQVAWWRLQGRRIVFTNGCFDLVHSGHLSLLRTAASFGDVLIVGINSDASVSRLKGPERPLVTENERAELLAALDCVDAVTLFEQDTPLELIEAIEPDVLVKGGDYDPQQVVGREVVERRGGHVRIVPLVQGRSTTDLVSRILGSKTTR